MNPGFHAPKGPDIAHRIGTVIGEEHDNRVIELWDAELELEIARAQASGEEQEDIDNTIAQIQLEAQIR
ncbi:MAG: hypothetical protein AAF357_15635, partial [Verrucomicrobiota bacterium]